MDVNEIRNNLVNNLGVAAQYCVNMRVPKQISAVISFHNGIAKFAARNNRQNNHQSRQIAFCKRCWRALLGGLCLKLDLVPCSKRNSILYVCDVIAVSLAMVLIYVVFEI